MLNFTEFKLSSTDLFPTVNKVLIKWGMMEHEKDSLICLLNQHSIVLFVIIVSSESFLISAPAGSHTFSGAFGRDARHPAVVPQAASQICYSLLTIYNFNTRFIVFISFLKITSELARFIVSNLLWNVCYYSSTSYLKLRLKKM